MPAHYQTEKEIEAVVRGFENCSIAKNDFTHREHLTVAVWYLRHYSPQQALDKMRFGLFRFLEHHGIGQAKYNESLTVSWMTLINSSLQELSVDLAILDATNFILDRLGDPRLLSDPSSRQIGPEN